jgi:hypothetical protein
MTSRRRCGSILWLCTPIGAQRATLQGQVALGPLCLRLAQTRNDCMFARLALNSNRRLQAKRGVFATGLGVD